MTKTLDAHEHAPLEPEIADALLARLGSDDAFRDMFTADPVEALALLGHRPAIEAKANADTTAFGCMKVNTLASKDEFIAARDELRSRLTAAGNHTVVFYFEADRTLSTLRSR